jgi:tetratricopeptide (TPR) repeat protein
LLQLAALALAPAAVRADEPPRPAVSAEDHAAAEDRYRAAQGEVSAHHLPAAAQALQQALALDPDHAGARALLARTYRKLGDMYAELLDRDRQQEYYRKALDLAPALVEDAGFRAGYRIAAVRPQAVYQKDEYEVEQIVPREGNRLGLALANGWAGGFMGVQANGLILGHLMPSLTLGILPVSTLDVGAKYLPLSKRWSPYIGAGYWHRFTEGSSDAYDTYARLRDSVHFDLGFQLMNKHGFTMDLGVGLMVNNTTAPSSPYVTSSDSGPPLLPLPQVNLGWVF